VFAIAIHFYLGQVVLHSARRLTSEPALPTNIKLGWKRMEVANTLAYYVTEIITAVKGFIVYTPIANVIKNRILKLSMNINMRATLVISLALV
jgi:hypothetical protein